MQIVIDTNILRQEFFLKSRKSEMLIDYLSKTGHQVTLPEVVYKELLAIYKKTLLEKFGKVIKGHDDLARTLSKQVEFQKPSLNIDEQLLCFEENIRKKLQVKEKDIISINNAHLPDLVNRAINRIHPFSESKAEFRDALIWLTILDQANLSEDKIIAFISSNTKEFSEKEDTLHPKLLEEANAIGVSVEYFSSLDNFLKSKASKIEFITEDWLEEHLDIETLENNLLTMLETYKMSKITERAKEKDKHFAEISSIVQCTNTQITDFYVYEMTDGTIRVEVTLESELEVEYSTQEVRDDNWELEYVYNPLDGDFDVEPVHKREVVKEAGYKCFYPCAEFEVHLILKDQNVESSEIIDWYI